jgi:hypothetical protein
MRNVPVQSCRAARAAALPRGVVISVYRYAVLRWCHPTWAAYYLLLNHFSEIDFSLLQNLKIQKINRFLTSEGVRTPSWSSISGSCEIFLSIHDAATSVVETRVYIILKYHRSYCCTTYRHSRPTGSTKRARSRLWMNIRFEWRIGDDCDEPEDPPGVTEMLH